MQKFDRREYMRQLYYLSEKDREKIQKIAQKKGLHLYEVLGSRFDDIKKKVESYKQDLIEKQLYKIYDYLKDK